MVSAFLSGADAGNQLGMEGQATLDELANVSGGKAFFPRSAVEMDDIFEQIALELRHQYSIGYRPNNFVNDGKWHKIKVKVRRLVDCPSCLFARKKATSRSPDRGDDLKTHRQDAKKRHGRQK